jgi:hypothetical protein
MGTGGFRRVKHIFLPFRLSQPRLELFCLATFRPSELEGQDQALKRLRSELEVLPSLRQRNQELRDQVNRLCVLFWTL